MCSGVGIASSNIPTEHCANSLGHHDPKVCGQRLYHDINVPYGHGTGSMWVMEEKQHLK